MISRSLRFALLFAAFVALRGYAAEWQWSAEMPGIISSETDGPPRAFLWIPPDCQRVRGVVVGQHNMQEEPILEHPVFRAALRELGFAAVWITPPFDFVFQFEQGAGDHFNALMLALAKESGYAELAVAPVVPIGHSAAASFPWNFAAWNPARTIAAISVSGQWPYWDDPAMPPRTGDAIDTVPGLVTIGEYEWADERAAIGLKQRTDHPTFPLTMLGEAGGGHFEVSPQKVAYLTLYLRKAAKHRLPDKFPASLDAPITLKAIDPATTGWLVDRWRADEPTRVPAAPVSEYAEPDQAFWCFDQEHAVATEKFRMSDRGKRVALPGYLQNGTILPQDSGTPQQVTIPFVPLEDGITFKLSGTFLDSVPKGRPERWTGLKEGSPVARPATTAPVAIDPICGPVEKLAEDTFALRFYRMGLSNRNRTGEIWLAATHPGDAQFKCAVQQAVLRFPLRNEAGARQTITFAEIPNQRAGTATLKLHATSDAGPAAKVQFYVREGPAEIAGDTLTFTPIPPRARFPIRVTVVAWQYGHTAEPRLQTAPPVERTFLINR